MELEPLSVVVLTILLQGHSEHWPNVCDPFSCSQAKAAEHLLRLSGLIQCSVTTMKPRLLTDQQSVIVAMWSTLLMASVTALFICLKPSSTIELRVTRNIVFAFGTRSFTNLVNGSCATTEMVGAHVPYTLRQLCQCTSEASGSRCSMMLPACWWREIH